MGLSIYAYAKAIPVKDHLSPLSAESGVPTEWCNLETPGGDTAHLQAFVYRDFERSLEGLEPGRCYEKGLEDPDGFFHFEAGSYSGYNEWRNDLSEIILGKSAHDAYMALLEDPEQERFPFLELICFADNEGTIGPIAAGRLHADFVSHRSEYVRGQKGVDDWNVRKYDEFTRAFEMASDGDGGLVEFS